MDRSSHWMYDQHLSCCERGGGDAAAAHKVASNIRPKALHNTSHDVLQTNLGKDHTDSADGHTTADEDM